MAHHDPYRSLRRPGFRRLLAGNIAGTIGQRMQAVAVGWEIYDRTGSVFALGLVGLVQVLPVIGLVLPAGVMADRYPRRRIVVLAGILSGLSAVGLAGASAAGWPVGAMYAFLALGGMARALVGPAKGALLPQVVGRAEFSNAVTWYASGWQGADVVGPALGGLVLGWSHQAVPVYLLHAGLALLNAGLVAGIVVRPGTPPPEGRPHPSGWRAVAEGFRYVRGNQVLLSAITLDLFAVLLGGATTLLPVFAKDILRVGPSGLGWLVAAPSIGAVVMALVLAHRPPLERSGQALLLAVAGFGLATLGFGLSRSMALSLFLLALLGGLDSVSVVIRATLVQLQTPDDLRGRVGAVNTLFIDASNELGGFESGAVAAAIGPVGSVLVGGVGTMVTVAVVALRWPAIRRLGRLA